jgi:hypothetical protein
MLDAETRRERVTQLIEFMRAHEARFNMREFVGRGDYSLTVGKNLHNCGTTFCIAGFAVALAAPDTPSHWPDDIRNTAATWLGLDTFDLTYDMFYRIGKDGVPTTLDEAVAMLGRFAETGEVQW